MSVPEELSVVTTSKCNLECTFCGGASYMDTHDVGRRQQRDAVLAWLENNPTVKSLNWTGGEPLLVFNKIEQLFTEVKSLYPELKHEIYSNGIKLKLQHVPLLQQFDRVCVSLDGYQESERPLKRLVHEGNFEAFEAFAELNNVHSWAVVTRDQLGDKYWYKDILALHKAIHHYRFKTLSVLLDNNMPKPLSPDHTMNFLYGYNVLQDNIERLNTLNTQECGFSVGKFFDHHCNSCSVLVRLDSDTSLGYVNDAPDVLEEGCNQLASKIGYDAYRYINRVLHARKQRIGRG